MENYAICISGGVIGNVNNINVDLSNVNKFTEYNDDEYEDKLTRYCFTDKTFDIKDALETSYSMLDLAEYSITIPLHSLTFLAPLTSLLKTEGILTDFSIYIQRNFWLWKKYNISRLSVLFWKI